MGETYYDSLEEDNMCDLELYKYENDDNSSQLNSSNHTSAFDFKRSLTPYITYAHQDNGSTKADGDIEVPFYSGSVPVARVRQFQQSCKQGKKGKRGQLTLPQLPKRVLGKEDLEDRNNWLKNCNVLRDPEIKELHRIKKRTKKRTLDLNSNMGVRKTRSETSDTSFSYRSSRKQYEHVRSSSISPMGSVNKCVHDETGQDFKPTQNGRYIVNPIQKSSYLEQFYKRTFGAFSVIPKESETSICTAFQELTIKSDNSSDNSDFSIDANKEMSEKVSQTMKQKKENDNIKIVRNVHNYSCDTNKATKLRDQSVVTEFPNYKPYNLTDYRSLPPPKMGRLGPDIEATKVKAERMKKQRDYGDIASFRNRQRIREKEQLRNMQKTSINEFTVPPLMLNGAPPFQKLLNPETSGTSSNCKPLPQTRVSCKGAAPRAKKAVPAKKKQISSLQGKLLSPDCLLTALQERHKQDMKLADCIRKEIR